MKHVQGIGGIFFKAQNPDKLTKWYDEHLGVSPLPHSPWGADDDAPLFEWRDIDNPERKCYTVFSLFSSDSDFFESSGASFILNLRVNDLDALLAELAEQGISPQGDIKEFPFGRFARVLDPEDNLIEFWEPAEGF